MQVKRLFETLYILLNERKIKSRELAERLEVSRRTILRDVDVLAMAGIAIYTSRGRDGGIFLMENFVMDKGIVSSEEQGEILMALESLAATENLDTKGLVSKLRSIFNQEEDSWIEVDFSRWGLVIGTRISLKS